MLQFGVCPQCKNELSQDRLQGIVHICDHCGWTDPKSNLRAKRELSKRIITTMIVMAIFMSVTYIHTVIWGKHSLSIIPLKAKQQLGMATTTDYKEIAKICLDRLKPFCAQDALTAALRFDSSNTELMAELGQLQEQLDNNKQALATYSHYFSNGGNSGDIAYNYARILDSFGQTEDAKVYFEYALKSKPDVFQITVSKDYVTFLMDHNLLREAKSFILKVRKNGENAPYFMDDELIEIKKRLVVAAR